MKKGFSLIELLIVISIMAILGSLALSAFSTARKQARDTQRKNELHQYKTALEEFYAANNVYPLSQGTPDVATSPQGAFDSGPGTLITQYMGGQVLQGVNPAEFAYRYISDTSGTIYKLWSGLEVPSNTFWEICSSGKIGQISAVSTTVSNCDIP